MTTFSYTAIDEDGKEKRGTIDAADVQAAKDAVSALHLEIVDIAEASRNRTPDSVPRKLSPYATFAFEGTDATGTVRRGTVQATTKFEAFQKLQADQKLTLKMLAPAGMLPRYNDPDLMAWQGPQKQPQVSIQSISANTPLVAQTQKPPSPPVTPPAAPRPKPTISFTSGPQSLPPAPPAVAKPAAPPVAAPADRSSYMPVVSTLRLYSGWLLAWYGFFVAIGYFAVQRALPWDIPFVQGFFSSLLIFSFIVAIFLFLLLTEIHRLIHGRLITGALLLLAGIGGFVGFRMAL